MKIWDIIKEDFEQPLEEGWREGLLATIMGVSSLFASGKSKFDNKNTTTNINVNQDVKKDLLTLDISKLFISGQYVVHTNDSTTLKNELVKFGKAIEENPADNFVIQIVSSESQVPNVDNEKSSPTYGEQLPTGGLALKRAETAKYIISNFVNDLKEKNILKGDINFLNPKILTGSVLWPSVDTATGMKRTKDDSLYTKDQYIYVNIKIVRRDTATYQEPKDTTNSFPEYAERGEEIYHNQHAYGFIFYPSKKTNNNKSNGNLNTAYQDVLFLRLDKNKVHSLTGSKTQPDTYDAAYKIPFQWWNKNISNQAFSNKNIADIEQFKVK